MFMHIAMTFDHKCLAFP